MSATAANEVSPSSVSASGVSTPRSEMGPVATTDPPSIPDESTMRLDGCPTTTATSDSQSTSTDKKKCGNQGVFHGEYKEYLQLRAMEYLTLNGRSERIPWLNGLVEDWFAKWPWHLNKEPEEFQVLSSPSTCQSLPPEAIKDLKDRRKILHDKVVKLGQEVSGLFFGCII